MVQSWPVSYSSALASFVWPAWYSPSVAIFLWPSFAFLSSLLNLLIGCSFVSLKKSCSHLLFSQQRSRQPSRASSGLWNCSVAEWSEFERHFRCNLETECDGGEDEAQCFYTGHCGKGRLTLDKTWVCVCLCVCLCVCVQVLLCIYVCACVHVYVTAFTRTRLCVFLFVCICGERFLEKSSYLALSLDRSWTCSS